MRIECPGCAAAYEVREELLPPGREVRCLRCGWAWTPAAPETPARSEGNRLPPPAGTAPEAPPPRRPMPLRVRPRLGAPAAEHGPPPALPPPHDPPEEPFLPPPGLAGPLFAWAASLALLVGGLAALWIWRAELVAFWPPAGRLVQALGGG